MGTNTPWGVADHAEQIAIGIMSYSTPSHGGIHLSPARQAMIPDYMRRNDGWYEEDCDWALVATVFPEYFTKYAHYAKETLKNWHPDAYEQFYHVKLASNESYMRSRKHEAVH
jgi:hypothetical protein